MQQETVEGIIANISFYNPGTGRISLDLRLPALRPTDDESIITVEGKLLNKNLKKDQSVRFKGEWNDKGTIFKAKAVELIDEIESAPMPVRQGKPDLKEKEELLRFTPVKRFRPGQGDDEGYDESRPPREVQNFLQPYELKPWQVSRIYEVFGDDTISEVSADPYTLVMNVEGIGFAVADQIASKMGIPYQSPGRIRAGIIATLANASADGHVFAPQGNVIEKAAGLLQVEPELCEAQLLELIEAGDVVAVSHMPFASDTIEALYLPEMYAHEEGVAQRLRGMVGEKRSKLKGLSAIKRGTFFKKLEKESSVELTDQQKEAVKAALMNKISILTGGPGTGKTTTLRTVIRALESIQARYELASPTGRAAKRLSEATERTARTVHRLLGYSPENGFLRGPEFPIEADYVIVDEASMLDISLFYQLLSAMTDEMHLLLVGDVDQLPSVGPGDVLRDVIRSGLAHVTRLDAIFRQANDSLIIANAHSVNHGQMPDLSNKGDFYMFPAADPDDAIKWVIDVVQNRIPRKFNLHPLDDVQVLAPMYKGGVGIDLLNERLQAALNPPNGGPEQRFGERIFRVGDKVMQTRNDYEKEVFNGDIGRITDIDTYGREIEVTIDDRPVRYKWKDLPSLAHAYAISIHRSQGGEYPAVVIPVVPQYGRMLQRNLFYTAITRARTLVVLVGVAQAIQRAVENDRVTTRFTGLLWHLGDGNAQLAVEGDGESGEE